MTMLLLIVEPADGIVRWASAGHDPALLYDPETDDFHELEGADLILGVEVACQYHNFQHIGIRPGCVLFIGTDGVWEARDAANDMFGKDRLRDVIRRAARRGEGSAREVADALNRALDTFVGSSKFHDDVTFVVAKFIPMEAPVESMPVVSVAGEERL
jgi:sigma-B regulation protein RsbU (phosphoserine phosphatase)